MALEKLRASANLVPDPTKRSVMTSNSALPFALALSLLMTTSTGATGTSTVTGASFPGSMPSVTSDDCVILLHGLARTTRSMNKIEKAFGARSYQVVNQGYPSRDFPIEELAPMALSKGLDTCRRISQGRVHVVTHSMGGILLRQFLANNEIADLGRVVMIAPPNQGSEVVDYFARIPGFRSVNGPAGLQLGTDAASIPRRLPDADFDVGVIAGTTSINLLLSTQLPGPNDGKVTVEATRLTGMRDFITMPHSHPMLIRRKAVIDQALHYIEHGKFKPRTQ